MRVLVCGGRDYTIPMDHHDPLDVECADLQLRHLQQVLEEYLTPDSVLISGVGRGADAASIAFAESKGILVIKYPANWWRYKKAAGPFRNQQMIDEGKPDIVLAFPGGRGTADMKKRARQADIPVKEIT